MWWCYQWIVHASSCFMDCFNPWKFAGSLGWTWVVNFWGIPHTILLTCYDVQRNRSELMQHEMAWNIMNFWLPRMLQSHSWTRKVLGMHGWARTAPFSSKLAPVCCFHPSTRACCWIEKAPQEQSATIFGLTTLLASRLIYNVPQFANRVRLVHS